MNIPRDKAVVGFGLPSTLILKKTELNENVFQTRGVDEKHFEKDNHVVSSNTNPKFPVIVERAFAHFFA